MGRTARNGASGEALSFVTPQETGVWNRIAKKYQIEEALFPESKKKTSRKKKKKSSFGSSKRKPKNTKRKSRSRG